MKVYLILILFSSLIFAGCSPEKVEINDPVPINFTNYEEVYTKSIVITEDEEHYLVDRGQFFLTHYYESGIPNNQNRSLLLITDSKNVHLSQYLVTTDLSPEDIELYEDVIVSNNGTELETFNFNRQNSTNATMKVYYNPTITNYGTLLNRHLTIDNKKVGGISGIEETHFVLKPQRYYIVQVENRGGGLAEALWNIHWYETN